MRAIMRCPTSVWRWTTAHSMVSAGCASSSAAGIAALPASVHQRHQPQLVERLLVELHLLADGGLDSANRGSVIVRPAACWSVLRAASRTTAAQATPTSVFTSVAACPKLAAVEHTRPAIAPHLDQERHLRVEPQQQPRLSVERASSSVGRTAVGIADPGGVRPAAVEYGQRDGITVELGLAAKQLPTLRRAGEAGHPGAVTSGADPTATRGNPRPGAPRPAPRTASRTARGCRQLPPDGPVS